MARSNYKSDYKEAIAFVTIPKSCVAFYRSKRKTILFPLLFYKFVLKISNTVILGILHILFLYQDKALLWGES
jgi:hypothetical protein